MKNILITGTSRGLGLKILESLLNDECTVYGISRSFSEDLEILEQNFSKNLFLKKVDLSKLDKIHQEIFKAFVTNEIPLHGFVNNAAQAYDDIITNLSIDRLKSMFDVNVFSPLILTKYAIRNMIFNQVRGSIVHISSISVHTGYKGLAMYAATKGALEAFSKNTAREWGEKGIRSNCIVAGFMETNMSSTLTDDQKNRIFNRTALKCATKTESVADTVCFLLSDRAKSITGQNFFVDSGTI